jgi:hypothetical protein
MTRWIRRAASAVAVKVLAATVAVVMVTALPTAASARRFTPRSGSYTGLAAGQQMTFWVAPGGRRMVNVAFPAVVLSCVGGGAVGDHFGFATARIRPNGTFRTAGTQTGIANGVSSTYAYSFGGHFSRGGASGSFRMTIRPTAGAVGHACTSNLQTWKATLDEQPRQTNALAPGGYKGLAAGQQMSFDLSSGRVLQGVSLPAVVLSCLGGGAIGDHIQFATVPVGANGAFAARATQAGVLSGSPATFTYAFSGSFTGRSPTNVPRAGGMFREDVVLADGRRCTSNDQLWAATLSP